MLDTQSAGPTAVSLRTSFPRVGWVALGLLLALALAVFGWRGVARAVRGTVDFPTFYGGARAWLNGANPYDLDTVRDAYASGRGDPREVNWFIYPPQSLPLLAPFGALPYPAANRLWLLLTLALIALTLWRLSRAAGLRDDPRALLGLVAFTLALSPFHTSVSQGQLSVAVTAFAALALADPLRVGAWAPGVWLALGASLKPQMVVAYGFYFLLRGNWRVCLAAGGTLLLLGALGVVPMEANGIPWLSSLGASLRESSSTLNNPAQEGMDRYIILSLPMLLYLVVGSPAVVQAITLAFATAVGSVILRVGRRLEAEDPVLLFALLGELGLLVTYHRIYDATLLVFPLAWALGRLRRPGESGPALATLGLLAGFIPSGTAVLIRLTQSGRLPGSLTNSAPWRLVALPHAVWLVLALLAVHLYVATRPARKP